MRQQLRRYLKDGVDHTLAEDDFDGKAKARLATAIGEVGDPDDSIDLLKLTRADIQRSRAGGAAFAQNNRSPKAQGGIVSWPNWYVQALIRLDCDEAESSLLELLKEPEYELDASWGLHALAKSSPGTEPILAGRFGWPSRDYRLVRAGSYSPPAIFDEHRRAKFAFALKQRILAAMDEARRGQEKTLPYNHRRIKELTRVLASLDPEHSADLIMGIAELPGTFDGWTRAALIEMLLFAGVALAADRVLRILDPAFAELRRQGNGNGGDASLYGQLLSILPFLEPPERGIQRIRELSWERRPPELDRNLLVALGQSSSEDGFLRELPSRKGAAFQHIATDWIGAVASCPHPAATATLMSFIDPESALPSINVSIPEYAVDRLAFRIAERGNQEARTAERIRQLCEAPTVFERLLLCKVVVQLDDSSALLAALSLIDDGAPQPVPYDLWKAIEDVVLEKNPHKENSSTFTLVPRAATDVKNAFSKCR